MSRLAGQCADLVAVLLRKMPSYGHFHARRSDSMPVTTTVRADLKNERRLDEALRSI